MEDKLVYESDQILRTLLDKKLGVNETLKKTSLARNRGLKLILYLEQSGMISRTKDPKHKQKGTLELTEFGKDLGLFGKDLDNFEQSFNKLLEKIKTNFDDVEQKYSKKIQTARSSSLIIKDNESQKELDKLYRLRNNYLTSISWTKNEIKDYEIWKMICARIKFEFLDRVIEFIIFKYMQFSLQYPMNLKASGLLSKVIERKTIFYVQKKIKLYEDEYKNSSFYDEEPGIIGFLESLCEDYTQKMMDTLESSIDAILDNRFVIGTIRRIILDMMSVGGIDKKYLLTKSRSIMDLYERIKNPEFRNDYMAKKPVLEFYIDLVNNS